MLFEISYEKKTKKARKTIQENSLENEMHESHESKKKPAADASKGCGLEIGEGAEDVKSKSGTLAAKQPGWTRQASRRKAIDPPIEAPRVHKPSAGRDVIDLTGDP